MTSGLKLLGLFLCVVIATNAHSTPVNSLEDLATIQRDFLFQTFDFFNASVNGQLDTLIGHLKALDARLKEVEGRLEDYAASRAVIETPVEHPEPEPEPTTTTRKPKQVKATTTTPTPTTTPPTTTPPTTTPTTTVPTTTPTTMAPTTTPLPTPATCAELASRGETVSGTYLIDPTRSGNVFMVYCELPEGVTVVNHNVANREVQNNGNELPASFSLDPVYDATVDQMKALTAASQSCSQFIKYRCRGAILLAEDKKGLPYGYWESVDGEQIRSWGGAPINSQKCACGVDDSCVGGKKCQCDSNPKKFAIDEGEITDKPYLPVTNVRLGDTGSKKEEGYVTLGPLRCQG